MMRRVALLFAGLLLFGASPAFAHADFVSMDPAPGSTVSELSVVTLTFSEDITALGSTVVVLDPNGESIQAGLTAQGVDVSVPVNPPVVTGEYTVNFRVVSVDAHVIEGSQKFTYDGSVPMPIEEPLVTAAPEVTSSVVEDASRVSIAGISLLAVVAALGIAVVLLRKRS